MNEQMPAGHPRREHAAPDTLAPLNLSDFGLSDMVRTGARLRAAAQAAPEFAGACQAVVRQLHAGLTDPGGRPAVVLARLFTSRRLDELPAELRRVAAGQLPAGQASDAVRCLVLEASAGDEPSFNDPVGSAAHRVIPPPSADAVAGAPMAAALFRDLELSATDSASGGAGSTPRTGVFHVEQAAGSADVPDQEFVTRYKVASALGFGGRLPGGSMFAVVMYSHAHIPPAVARRFEAVAVFVRAGLLEHLATRRPHPAGAGDREQALAQLLEVLEAAALEQATDLERAAARNRAEADLVDALHRIGRELAAELDLERLVQAATDAATAATGAAFGSFFYNVVNDAGESYMLYTLSGVPKEAFAQFPMPRNTPVFANTFEGHGTVRSGDITADPRYGRNPPHHGMPKGHLPVRSYLAVPVISPSSGEVLGGFFFGHPEPDRFTARHERLAEGIAGHTATAMDNARLYSLQRDTAAELQRSMLPDLPDVHGLTIVSRYLPAATGTDVGGDWVDVIALPAGRTAFVVGDVMGRGVRAAAIMGQIRTAVRSYAHLDLPPATVMAHLSELTRGIRHADLITCLYAVHDPVEQTLTYASAGHLPPAVISPDGQVELMLERLGLPLGIGEVFQHREISLPTGAGLFLYTDGLVEDRRRVLDDGLDHLVRQLGELAATTEPEDTCDKLIANLTGGQHDDDVATLYIRLTGDRAVTAELPSIAGPTAAADARAFVTDTLLAWHLTGTIEAAVTVASELVTTAVRGGAGPVRLRLHHADGYLTIDVLRKNAALTGTDLFDNGRRAQILITAHATRWGTRPTPTGDLHWAEITLSPRRRRP